MCGIAGVVTRYPFANLEGIRHILQGMGNQLAHRGPDDSRLLLDKNVALIFKRLSIVDLNTGMQPFISTDESVVVMVNGEIYNHKELKNTLLHGQDFKSQSDCEVVLHLYLKYGIDGVQHLNGIYSFAVFDKKINRVFLVRDRLGVKPLYYCKTANEIIFASEIKALFGHPKCSRELDWDTALSYKTRAIQFGNNSNLSSFFKNIVHVEAGTITEVDLCDFTISSRYYWQLPDYSPQSRIDPEFYIQQYRELLEDSVRLQLMSDVEIGAFLSGGIDSVVLCYLAQKYGQFHTFTVLSQSTLGNGDAKHAHLASRELDLPNHQVVFDWHDAKFDAPLWKSLLWLLETPFTNAEHLYKYHLHKFARRIRPDLKVILLGQGSDEFNGGYSISWQKEANPHLQKPTWEGFCSSLIKFRDEELMQNKLPMLGGRYCYSFGKPLLNLTRFDDNSKINSDPWQIYLQRNINQLQMYNLWHEDRTSSGNSIESRVPYLDHRIVEFIQTIPKSLHKELFWDKSILRKAFAAELPETFLHREKVPFFYGKDVRYTNKMLHRILSDDDSSLVREVIEDTQLAEIYNRDALWNTFLQIGKDPSYRGVEIILELINMGQLQILARDGYSSPSAGFGSDLDEYPLKNWEADVADLELALGQGNAKLTSESILKLCRNVRLVEDVKFPKVCFISVNNELKYSLDLDHKKAWLDVLAQLDGIRSVSTILDRLSIEEYQIRKDMEEALEFNLIEMIS